MKTIYSYVLKEMLPSFLVSLGILTALFMTNKMFLLLDLVLAKKVPFSETFILYISLLPFILSMTIPMAMMMGTLLAFGRLSSDMEVTAFKGSGVHLFRLIAPVLVMGALMTALMLLFSGLVLPKANFAFKKIQFNILQRQASIAIREKVWIDKFEGFRFFIDHQNRDGSFANLKAFNNLSPRTTVQTTMAPSGTLETDLRTYQIFLHLKNGCMTWDNDQYQTYNQLFFQNYVIRLKLQDQLARMTDVKKGWEEMTLPELSQAIQGEKDKGEAVHFQTEMQSRLALPFSCLVLAWFCAPLGLWTRSKGFLGFVLGIAMIFLYYLMFIFGQSLSNQGTLNPILGLWGADITLGLAGTLIYYLAVAEQSAFRGFRLFPKPKAAVGKGRL